MERSADRPNIAASAGDAPAGALDGNEVLAGQRNLEDFGQASPTVVPEGYGAITGTEIATTGDTSGSETAPTILTGEEGAGGGGTTYGDVNAPNSDGTGEIAPYQSLDDLFEEYARSAFADIDTSGQEQLMREEQDRLLGQGLMDARASMGEAGFGMSGAEASLENTARSDAARQLGLDIGDLRRQAVQDRRDAIEGAMGIDLAKMSAAQRDAILKAQIDALNAMMGEGGEGGDAGGEGGGGGGDLATSVNEGINAIGEGAADLLGRGDGAREQQAQEGALHTPGVPDGANVVEYPSDSRENREAQLEASGYSWETVTDDGVTVYRNNESPFDRLYVRWS